MIKTKIAAVAAGIICALAFFGLTFMGPTNDSLVFFGSIFIGLVFCLFFNQLKFKSQPSKYYLQIAALYFVTYFLTFWILLAAMTNFMILIPGQPQLTAFIMITILGLASSIILNGLIVFLLAIFQKDN